MSAATPPPLAEQAVCPYCREVIRAGAIKCKHCGEFLDGRGASKSASGWDPRIAGLLSFFIVGAGQIYKGDFRRGVALLACYVFGFAVFFFVSAINGHPLMSAITVLIAMSVSLWSWGYGIYDAMKNPQANPNWWQS